MTQNEIVLFTDGDKNIEVQISPEKETVWLNRKQLSDLFDRDVKTIGKHINNAISEELDDSVVAKFATTGGDGKIYQVEYYNLDMIISIGYRVKSKRGIAFRRWANSVLKQYIINGYAINEKRLYALEKTVDIQTKMLANGQDVYPTLEEKASNLLYFIIKDHPFDDGCKRIAASLFLEFLYRNGMLYKRNEKRISEGALVAITLMIAESRAEEKEIMTTLVMNMLTI